MKISHQIEKIFYLYNIYLNRARNPHILLGKYSDEELNIHIQRWNNYVQGVDSILNTITEESRKILKAIYIEKKQICELHYSISTFYIKRKIAIKEFADYVGIKTDQQLIDSLGLDKQIFNHI